ncbi:MAG: hypothetical protein WC444_05910 [Candidatus Paceibacterota bacterium]
MASLTPTEQLIADLKAELLRKEEIIEELQKELLDSKNDLDEAICLAANRLRVKYKERG